MTNAEIVFLNSLDLMEIGVLKGNGIMFGYKGTDGQMHTLEMPEDIYTFGAWKKMGFAVRKGEHAKACFPVWKYIKDAGEAADDEDGDSDGKCYMKMAYFFTADQVEPLKKK